MGKLDFAWESGKSVILYEKRVTLYGKRVTLRGKSVILFVFALKYTVKVFPLHSEKSPARAMLFYSITGSNFE